MNHHRLLATWSGDEHVYLALEQVLESNLSKHLVKCEHNPTQTFSIPLKFVEYSSQNSASFANPENNLLEQPFLHIFFTACQDEKSYKNNSVTEQ